MFYAQVRIPFDEKKEAEKEFLFFNHYKWVCTKLHYVWIGILASKVKVIQKVAWFSF